MAGFGVGVYIVWDAGENERDPQLILQPYPTSTRDALPNIAAFPPIRPQATGLLQFPPSQGDIPPIGIYLPLSGLSQFALSTPTSVPPAVFAFPTSPPFAETVAVLAETFTAPTPATNPSLVPFGGVGCAPRGLPVEGIFTQYFHRWHSGIDLGVSVGTPVVATHSGTVNFADWSTIGYGYLVIIENGQFITYYAHLERFNVVAGESVGRGSIIGWSGNTGNSSGPHLHYEVRQNDIPLDPLTFEAFGYPTC